MVKQPKAAVYGKKHHIVIILDSNNNITIVIKFRMQMVCAWLFTFLLKNLLQSWWCDVVITFLL